MGTPLRHYTRMLGEWSTIYIYIGIPVRQGTPYVWIQRYTCTQVYGLQEQWRCTCVPVRGQTGTWSYPYAFVRPQIGTPIYWYAASYGPTLAHRYVATPVCLETGTRHTCTLVHWYVWYTATHRPSVMLVYRNMGTLTAHWCTITLANRYTVISVCLNTPVHRNAGILVCC